MSADKLDKVVDSLLTEQEVKVSDVRGRIAALASKVAEWTGKDKETTIQILDSVIWVMSMEDEIMREVTALAKKLRKDYEYHVANRTYLR